jgi:hypothetical protein
MRGIEEYGNGGGGQQMPNLTAPAAIRSTEILIFDLGEFERWRRASDHARSR